MTTEIQKRETSQFDILDILHIIFLKKWIMISIIILSTLLGALLYAIYPQSYKGVLIIKPLNEKDNHKYIVISSLFKILKSSNDVEFQSEDEIIENQLSNSYLANYFTNKFNAKIELRENILKYSNNIIDRGDYSSMDEEEYTYSISQNFNIKKSDKGNYYILDFVTQDIDESELIIINTFKSIEENIRSNYIKEIEAYKDMLLFKFKGDSTLQKLQNRSSILYKLLEFNRDFDINNDEDIQNNIDIILKIIGDFDKLSIQSVEKVYEKLLQDPIINTPGNFKAVNYDINLATYTTTKKYDLFLIISIAFGFLASILYIFIIIISKFYKTKNFTD